MGEEAFVAFPETVNTALESIELFRVGMWLRLTASCAPPFQGGVLPQEASDWES